MGEIMTDIKKSSFQVIETICDVLNTSPDKISSIVRLNKGMTNHSYIFAYNDSKYIIRIPGEGTNKLIDRKQEETVYKAIAGLNLCEDPLYINSDDGIMITKYIDNARCCDPNDEKDLKQCMAKLRKLHSLHLIVDHEFDLYETIDKYERLWNGKPSVHNDYQRTKNNVLSLKNYLAISFNDKCLTHIDAVPTNFLFDSDNRLQLTDWEYAGMQDPHVDIAMFCIYSLYDKKGVDRLIDIYFENIGGCPREIRGKIYSYISICGLLWSNWCEFKLEFGVNFGQYAQKQYQYAIDYYDLVTKNEF